MLAIGDYAYRDYTSKNGIVSVSIIIPIWKTGGTHLCLFSRDDGLISEETGLNFPWPTYANVPVQEFLMVPWKTLPLRFTDAPCSRWRAERPQLCGSKRT